MKYTYEVNEKYQVVLRSDGAAIPMDESNSDYQRYLSWLENPDVEAEDLNGSVDGEAL